MARSRPRPPWWPEGEPWPPRGGMPGGQAILRRLLFIGLAFFVLMLLVSTIVGFVVGGGERHGPPPLAGLGILILIALLVFAAGRMARRYTNPMGNVMAALDRLANGDYSVRVETGGPPAIRALAASLNTTAARLEASEEQRRNLIADIAHEVRNPLAIIRGNVEGMVDGLYETEPARLAPILEEVDVIARLVDDLSTLSSAEAGTLQLHPESTDLEGLVRDVAASFAVQADAAGVSLGVEAAPAAPMEVDGQRIRQVLENLVSNALRHTDTGGSVTLGLRLERDGTARFEVADTGSGIPPDELPHIFERYRKTPDSTGSGLGLAIARSLVEAHGGSISAESEPGRGTTISFRLPRK